MRCDFWAVYYIKVIENFRENDEKLFFDGESVGDVFENSQATDYIR